jgi:uncharacterized protein (DUF305 family)
MRTRLLLIIGLIGLAGLIGAACSSDDDSTVTGATGNAAAGEHNDADVTFAQGMIPHHRQAVEMAQLAAGRAEDPRVLDLASRIEGAQDPEIAEMSGWLEDWDEDVPAEGGHDDMTGMSGMMTAEDMDALEAASGGEFDEMFLTMMIEHHRGAVEMANTELDDGKFADALSLAQKIIDAQEAEISEMEAILGEASTDTGAGSTTSTKVEDPVMSEH